MSKKIIYLPGWLNPAENMRPLANMVGEDYELLNLPADAVRTVPEMARWVVERITEPVFIAGHSFGGKIAVAIAALYPEKIKGIFVIAGSNRGRWIFRLMRPAIKIMKMLGISGTRFQTADYRNSSPIMKQIMKKTLNFDIMPLARRVKVPAVFVYGTLDATTPPKLGKKIASQITNAKFFELDGFNHNSIITSGVYQVSAVIKSGLDNP